MAAAGMVCLGCLCLGWIISCVAISIPFWQQNDAEDTINENIMQNSGLWIQCISMSTGNWECDDYETFFLALPVMQQAARGLGISSLVLGFVGIVLIGISLEEGKFGASYSQMKRNRLIAGGVSILAGFCIMAGASWYANDIVNQYMIERARMMHHGRSTTRIVFGSALFLAWGGGALQIIGGIVALCFGCSVNDSDDRRPYAYRSEVKPLRRTNEEYV